MNGKNNALREEELYEVKSTLTITPVPEKVDLLWNRNANPSIPKEEDWEGEDYSQFQDLLNLRNKEGLAIHHLGIKITKAGPGWAEGEMVFQPYLLNPIGSVHGGMIFSLADSVGGTAACTRGSLVTTANATIHYLNAAMSPKRLLAKAEELKAGKNLLTYEVSVWTEEKKLVAKVTLEYFSLHKPLSCLREKNK